MYSDALRRIAALEALVAILAQMSTPADALPDWENDLRLCLDAAALYAVVNQARELMAVSWRRHDCV